MGLVPNVWTPFERSVGEKVKCTYIEVDQAAATLPCILSKPEWMWGAEMGANSLGVVIGRGADHHFTCK
jgi:hypothetical protein